MKNIFLIILNYVLIILIGVIDYFDIVKIPFFEWDLGYFVFNIILELDQDWLYLVPPLSIFPFLVGFIKSNRWVLFSMVLYLTAECYFMSMFVTGIHMT